MRVAIPNSTRFSLRVEHLRSPAVASPKVDLALVQPARHPLPEFDPLRRHQKARPVRGTRHRFAIVLALEARDAFLEISASGQRSALRRSPRPDLTAPRPGGEVSVGLVVRDRSGAAFDSNLHFERLPVKAQRRPLGREQLTSLPTLMVGIEDEPAL